MTPLRLLSLVALLALAGCPSGPRGRGGAADAGKAVVVFRGGVPDATVWIDERLVGELADLPGGVRLRAGTRQLEVRHDRFHTRYVEVTLRPGERRVVELDLVEILD